MAHADNLDSNSKHNTSCHSSNHRKLGCVVLAVAAFSPASLVECSGMHALGERRCQAMQRGQM